jgi:hypothetical protein
MDKDGTFRSEIIGGVLKRRNDPFNELVRMDWRYLIGRPAGRPYKL